MAEPSGIDPADPKGAEPGGTPSAEQKAKRLEQEVADLKKQLEEAKGQVTTLTENLGKALTEDDVKTAVEAAKQEAEKAQQEAAAAASQREKRLVVENELIKARCIDTAGAIAHIDMDGVQIAPDGHVSGLDVSKLAKDCGHLGSSPRMRGAQTDKTLFCRHIGIIPAYAGSTSCNERHRYCGRDHPRVCGEHDWVMDNVTNAQGSSPRMRGAQAKFDMEIAKDGIIPAYAGSTRHHCRNRQEPRDHPRVCGEHTWLAIPTQSSPGSSPRMRGARGAVLVDQRGAGIIPAYAGSTRKLKATLNLPAGSSPRMRGAPAAELRAAGGAGIIPAYAGSTKEWQPFAFLIWDHPRVCGEHDLSNGGERGETGSSPRMRGARDDPRRFLRADGIIPAYAGSTSIPGFKRAIQRDHPRVCGEHNLISRRLPLALGSSPRMRGARGNGNYSRS